MHNFEAIRPETLLHRRSQIEAQLLEYFALDTNAIVPLWQVFATRTELKL